MAAVVAAEAWSLAEGYRDARACLNTLPALEESGDLIVRRLTRASELNGVFDIDYRVTNANGSVAGRLRCAFSDGPDGRHLAGLELRGRMVGEARLYFLERFWLDDPAAVQSGAGRLTNEISPLEFLTAVIGRPRPSLLVALLFALLAIAAIASSRFAGRGRRD